MSELEIAQWTDDRNFNLLMVAAEGGHLETVNLLIKSGLNVNHEVKFKTAASLAFANKHFQVVLALLKANSKFPRNYNNEEASNELKTFVALSTNLHDKIRTNNQENLKEILTENPSLRHHYDTNNNSALKIAIITAMFSMVEFLLNNNIILGPHEDMEDLVRHLTQRKRRKLRDLHLRLSKHIFSSTLMTFMRNCRFGPDDDGTKNPEYMSLVSKAFHFLLEIPSIAIILKIVAATRDFILVFDFNREWTNYADPTSEPYTNGLFNVSGKIYIGAKNLLDPLKAIETYSVIAHELCHFAMFLVFKNMAKPYRQNDQFGEHVFQTISDECEAQMESEEIIKSVYDCYPPEMFHAELVVRAPQMIVFYHNQPELDTSRTLFPTLLDYFERVSVPALENALPDIEEEHRPKIEKKVKKYQNFVSFLSFLMLFLISGSVLGAFFLFNPTVSYEELSSDDKLTFNNASVNFHSLEVKFCDLFANDSEVYGLLSSEQLKKALNGDTTDLSMTIEAVYLPFIYLTWSNMTEDLKNKAFNSNVNFQGEEVALSNILSGDSALELLKSNKIRDLLTDQSLNISEPAEIKTKFFVDRFFIDEDLIFNAEKLDKTEQWKSFNDVTEIVSQEKVFLLSSLAGEGKSTTFRNFALKFKQKFPSKWVQFVDLKKYSKKFKIAGNLRNLDEILQFLGADLLKLENLELKVFEDRFEAHEVIFLWDGIDEISPLYKDFMLSLTSKVHKLTENLQFVSTRPQYSKDFERNFNIKAYKLIPLQKSERFELLIKFFATEVFNLDVKVFKSQNFSENFETEIKNLNSTETSRFLDLVAKGRIIFGSIETSHHKNRLVTNPLLIKMIAEIISDENINLDLDFNVYQIFDIFITKKLELVFKKGDEAINSIIEITKKSTVNIMQVHQAIALRHIFSSYISFKNGGSELNNLNIMKSTSKLTNDEISRYGIVQVTSDGEFTFTHQTFAEFLVAQFFIVNMNEFDATADDTKIRLILFDRILFHYEYNVVRDFLMNYEKPETNLEPIIKFHRNFTSKFKNKQILNFFLLKEISLFFQIQYKINYLELFTTHLTTSFTSSKYKISDTFSWEFNDFNEFISNWDKFERVLGFERMKFPLMERDEYHETILHKVSKLKTDELFKKTLDKISEKLNQAEMISLFECKSIGDETALMYVVRYNDAQNVELFWNLLATIFTENEQKKFLIEDNTNYLTTLQYATWNKDPKSFLFMSKMYESLFRRREIQDIFLNTYVNTIEGYFLLFGKVIEEASLETAREVVKYLKKIFKDEKLKLRELLSRRDKNSASIFSKFKDKKVYEEKWKVFVELLRETFDKNDDENYEQFLKASQHPSKLGFFAKMQNKHNNSMDFALEARSFRWAVSDFDYFVSNWEKIQQNVGTEKFNSLLMSKGDINQTLLYDLIEVDESEILLEPFLQKLKLSLSKNDIKTLLLAQNTWKNLTALTYLAQVKMKKYESLKSLWKFSKEILSENEQKMLLMIKNEKKIHLRALDRVSLTALHCATWNEDPNLFLFMKEIYESLFSQRQIQEFFSKPHKKFILLGEVIEEASLETAKEVANYLAKLFEGEKIKLIKFLNHQDKDGNTIFRKFRLKKYHEEKLKVFIELLRQTFDYDEENLEKFMKNSWIPSEFAYFLSLQNKYNNTKDFILKARSFTWVSSDFDYLVSNCEKIQQNVGTENFNSLLISKDEQNRTLLYELIKDEANELFLEPFLDKLKLSLSKNEVKTLLLARSTWENATALMYAAQIKRHEILKSIWNFTQEFLNDNEQKMFLTDVSSDSFVSLQYATWNKDPKSFLYMTEIYGSLFTQREIQEFFSKAIHKILLLGGVIEKASLETIKEVANYLAKVFEGEKLRLRELLSYRDEDGNTIFRKFKACNLKLKVFEKLLRDTSQ